MAAKIKIYTLGCKANQYDSGKLAAKLARAGFIIADRNADLAVVNSCAVTKTAMVKSARMIRLAKKENPEAKIALAGCWPRAEEIKENGVDLILKNGDVKKFVAAILPFRASSRSAKCGVAYGPALATTGRSRYFIKIQDGCEQYCTYCIIPYTRGKLKSRGENEIICEIRQAVKAGYREVVLSGIHLGLYGRQVKSDLVGLLKKIIKIPILGRIRLSSIEILEVMEELINLMAKSKKICRHLHMPLQSGSNKILKLMNRPYNAAYFKNKILRIRNKMPDIAISTDVMAGFPGETEKDFRDTVKLLKQIKFSRLHVFPFSAHKKTPAAKFPGQVAEKTKESRAEILRRLGVKLAEDYKKKFKGKELGVAVERIEKNRIIGKTEYYFEVEFKKNQVIGEKFNENSNLIGRILKVKIRPN